MKVEVQRDQRTIEGTNSGQNSFGNVNDHAMEKTIQNDKIFTQHSEKVTQNGKSGEALRTDSKYSSEINISQKTKLD